MRHCEASKASSASRTPKPAKTQVIPKFYRILWGVLDLRRFAPEWHIESGTANQGLRSMRSSPWAATREAQHELSARLSGFRFSRWKFGNDVFSTVFLASAVIVRLVDCILCDEHYH